MQEAVTFTDPRSISGRRTSTIRFRSRRLRLATDGANKLGPRAGLLAHNAVRAIASVSRRMPRLVLSVIRFSGSLWWPAVSKFVLARVRTVQNARTVAESAS